MYKKSVLILSMFFCSQVFADGTADVDITQLGVSRTNGGFAFAVVTPDMNISNCTVKNKIVWELDSEVAKSMLSLALTAKVSGQKIKVLAYDNDCLSDSPRPVNISIVD